MSGRGTKRPRMSNSSRSWKKLRPTVGPMPRGYARRMAQRQYGHKLFHAARCVEKKYHDRSAVTGTTAVGAASIIGIVGDTATGIAQDNTATGRAGARVFVWNANVQLRLDSKSDSASCNQVRIMLVVDRQSNGTAPAITDILETAEPLSFRNLENSGRFRFLYDKTHDVGNKGGAWDGTNDVYAGGCKTIKINRDLKGMKVQYENGTSTGYSGTVKDNNVWLVIIGSTANCDFKAYSRVRYSD
jgi:hypothetical protein